MRHPSFPNLPAAALRRWAIATAVLLVGSLWHDARAQDKPAAVASQANLSAAALACMSCHGTNGKAEGVGYMIGGKSAPALASALLDFKDGRRQGSVMPPITRAFSPGELEALAQEFSKYK